MTSSAWPAGRSFIKLGVDGNKVAGIEAKVWKNRSRWVFINLNKCATFEKGRENKERITWPFKVGLEKQNATPLAAMADTSRMYRDKSPAR